MRTIHVILGIQRLRLHWGANQDLLRPLLLDPDDKIEVTTCDQDEFAVARALRDLLDGDISSVDDPVIVITSFTDSNQIPETCSRLLMEFPEVSIIWMSAGTGCIRTFQLRVKEEEYPRSLKGLIEGMHECVQYPPPW